MTFVYLAFMTAFIVLAFGPAEWQYPVSRDVLVLCFAMLGGLEGIAWSIDRNAREREVTQLGSERRFSKLAAAINQKASRLGQPDRITPGALARVFIASDGHCRYCGIEIDWKGVSFDHVRAFARGGANTEKNLAASCITCQRTKHTKTPEEHAENMALTVACSVCGKQYKPRWADWKRGYGKTCSRKCSGLKGGQAERASTALPS